MVAWELGEDELVGFGVSIGRLTKRNILTVWIFVIEGVVVIEAGGMEEVGRTGVSLGGSSWMMSCAGSGRLGLSCVWSEPAKVGMSQLHFGLLF